MTYYKALDGLESCYGGHATWEPGRWMPWVKNLIPCKQGYHVCDGERQLLGWLAQDIWIAEVKGEVVNIGDKVYSNQVRIVKKTAWNDNSAVRFARDCTNRINGMISRYAAHARSAVKCAAYARSTAAYAAAESAAAYARSAAEFTALAAAYSAAESAAAESSAHAAAYTAYAAERRWQAERLKQYL